MSNEQKFTSHEQRAKRFKHHRKHEIETTRKAFFPRKYETTMPDKIFGTK